MSTTHPETCTQGGERIGRFYSKQFDVHYDLYPCEIHGQYVDVDFDKVW